MDVDPYLFLCPRTRLIRFKLLKISVKDFIVLTSPHENFEKTLDPKSHWMKKLNPDPRKTMLIVDLDRLICELSLFRFCIFYTFKKKVRLSIKEVKKRYSYISV